MEAGFSQIQSHMYLITIIQALLYCRDSESSTVPLNYQRNNSIDKQDSGSQLSTPRTLDSFMSEHMPFRMSTNGPLDPIQESPLPDDRPHQPTPKDGRVVWTVGPAASNNDDIFDEPRSPMVNIVIKLYVLSVVLCILLVVIYSINNTFIFVSTYPQKY